MRTAAACLVVEDDDPGNVLQVIAPIRPHVGTPGLAAARIELLNRCLVGVQRLPLFEPVRQAIDEGLQPHAQLADPLRERRAGDRHAVALADLLDTIERQVVEVFLDQYPGM